MPFDDIHMAKLAEQQWRMDHDFKVAFYVHMVSKVWNCNICYSLVDDRYCVEHRGVCNA